MNLLRVTGRKGQRGQAAVESAIILPVMVFMVLGTIQLTMVQQAELMTEYAAYQACRAGVVWNGNNDKMVDAARVALAPTIGASNLFADLKYAGGGSIHEGAAGMAGVVRNVASLAAADAVLATVHAPKIIRVDVVNPLTRDFDAAARFTPVNGRSEELFFDDIGEFGGQDGFTAHEEYRKATQLTIRLRYLYELRIPFADWIIQTCFFAANAPRIQLSGMLGAESVGAGGFGHKTAVESGNEEASAGIAAGAANAISNAKGKPTMTKAEFMALYGARALGIYVVPLSATYTMRMQSNLYKKNLTN